MLVKPSPGLYLFPQEKPGGKRMIGRGDVAITTSSRQRPPFQGLVLHPSPGGCYGDEELRNWGEYLPHLEH